MICNLQRTAVARQVADEIARVTHLLATCVGNEKLRITGRVD